MLVCGRDVVFLGGVEGKGDNGDGGREGKGREEGNMELLYLYEGKVSVCLTVFSKRFILLLNYFRFISEI